MISDRVLGGILFILCIGIAIVYLVLLIWPYPLVELLLPYVKLQVVELGVRFWLIAIPVVIAVLVVLGIGAWIGWTMLTTPPPKIPEIPPTKENSEEKSKERES